MYSAVKIILTLTYLVSGVNGQEESSSAPQTCSPNKEVIKTLTEKYDNGMYEPSDQTEVVVEMWINSLNSLNINIGRLDLSVYMSETWLDKRMSYGHLSTCQQNITTTGKIFEKIWTPDLHFLNNKNMQQMPVHNDFVVMFPNGTISRIYLINLIVPCDTDFSKFPMDSTDCVMTYESAIYNVDKIKLRPSNTPIQLISSQNLPSHNLINFSFSSLVQLYPYGLWAELSFNLKFARIFGWHILHVYVPSCALVFSSWISFCLGQAIMARVLLTFGSLLALLLQFCYAINDLPQISYMTRLDVWMSICLTFVLASIMELALFTIISRSNCLKSAGDGFENERLLKSSVPKVKRAVNRSTIVDIVFAVLFPLAFIVFVIIYCCT